MRKTILILFLALWPALAHAQSLTTVASALKGGATLPATCKPATSGSRADVFIKTGSSAGLYTCSAANTWTVVGGSSSSGDVVGPASATDNAVVRFDGTTGKLVQDSAVTIADTTGDITGGKYNKVTITAPATGSTLTILNGKTLTANNTLTLAGTDGSTLNIGAGGTLGSAAFTAASAYEVPLTFSTGLSRSTNTITVDQSFAPTWSGAHIHTSTIALTSTTAANNKITQGAAINIGTTSTDGIVLQNTTAAAAGAQQYSPALRLTGQGWKTTATAASQAVDFLLDTEPVQSSTSPEAVLAFKAQINGGGYTPYAYLFRTANNGPALFLGTTATPPASTATTFALNSDGSNFTALNSPNAGSNGIRFQLAGVTRALLSIQSSITSFQVGSGDEIGFNSAANPTGAPDVRLRRNTTASLVQGAADNATPVANTLTIGESSRGGTDSNITGANGTIRPGNGTGTGGSGAFKIQVAPAGSTGTTANTYADALSIANTKVATFSGAINGTTANFSGAITVASCTGCGGGTTINASGQGIWIPDVFYDADSFEGVAAENDVKFYRFINPIAVTADRADLKGVVAQASGRFSFALRSWDCATTTYFDSGVMDTTSWSNVDVTQTLSSNTLPAGGICLMWTHDNTTSKTRTVGPQANTMAVWNIPASGTKRLGTCSKTSSAGVLPGSCGTETGSNTQGVFQFTLRKN